MADVTVAVLHLDLVGPQPAGGGEQNQGGAKQRTRVPKAPGFGLWRVLPG